MALTPPDQPKPIPTGPVRYPNTLGQMPDMTKREGARAMGLKEYTTGRACSKGHLAPRYVSTGGCTKCAYLRMRKNTVHSGVGRPPTEVARHIARLQGHLTYKSERPCARGHVGDRYTHSTNCCQCISETLIAPG